jgi:hypothetical protein
MLDRIFTRLAVTVSTAALLLGCAAERDPEARTLGKEVGTHAGTQAGQGVSVERNGDNIIYRAPLLSASDLGRSGPVPSSNVGEASGGQSSFLYGVRTRGSTTVQHFAVYGSESIEGKNRFASVTLADGSRPIFRAVTTDRRGCEPNCPTSEALVIALPDTVLRSAPDAGLLLTITLDDGKRFDVTIPAAYVRGYLQAVDARTA